MPCHDVMYVMYVMQFSRHFNEPADENIQVCVRGKCCRLRRISGYNVVEQFL